MPSRGVPSGFWLLTVFALLIAGIVAVAGFALDDQVSGEPTKAIEGSQANVEELVRAGTFPNDGTVSEAPAEQPAAEQPAPPAEQPAAGGEELLAGADPSRGQELFFANGCNVCHGDQGQGAIGPTIAQTGFTLAQVIEQYRTPRAAMPPFAADRVPDQDVAHIHAWLQTLPLPETIVPGLGTP